MTETTWHEISDVELDALIERVKAAIAQGLALSAEDMQRLLNALLSLAHWQERLAESDITLHKLRKLAGIVSASEKLKDVLPSTTAGNQRRQRPASTARQPPAEAVIHERCRHRLEGLQQGQRCPACRRGTLYK
jgi:hypothetical protein